MNGFRIMTILGQRCGDLPRHRQLIFNDQNFHKFIGNIGPLETDGKLCSQQMVVLAGKSRFVLVTVLQF